MKRNFWSEFSVVIGLMVGIVVVAQMFDFIWIDWVIFMLVGLGFGLYVWRRDV